MENNIKHASVLALIKSITDGHFAGNELFLVLPGCTIIGKPALNRDIVADDINDIPKDRWNAATMAKEIFPYAKDKEGLSIILYDAEVFVGGRASGVDSIIVFIEDIVAVSAVTFPEDE